MNLTEKRRNKLVLTNGLLPVASSSASYTESFVRFPSRTENKKEREREREILRDYNKYWSKKK